MTLEWIVDGSESNQRLGTFVQTKLEGNQSTKQVKRWIEGNRCQVNGVTERFASRPVKKGDRVSFQVPQEATKTSHGSVIFEDDDLVVYNKSAGETSEALIKRLERNHGDLGLVHRLDKDTGGVIVFARNNLTKKRMEDLFRERAVSKTYLALVDGIPSDRKGLIQSYLGKISSYEGQTTYGSVPEAHGLYAETAWECLQRGSEAALIACYPKTGRTHQLRVHLKELGTPILGDYQYARGQNTTFRALRQMLHAWKIAFVWNGNPVEFVAPLPDDFLRTARAFKVDIKNS
ncbi:MAG: RluA family pseudouridine synthase [Chlamydiales bacterium]|nr:RluA family pseudouridine synthase [Chlamydiales bacterium]